MSTCPREPDHYVLGPGRLDLEPRILVEHRLDDALDVVGGAGIRRDYAVETFDHSVRWIGGLHERRLFSIAGGEVGEKPPHLRNAGRIVRDLVVTNAGLIAVDLRAPHVVVCHVLTGRSLDQPRTSK